jgi:hypothetical protein
LIDSALLTLDETRRASVRRKLQNGHTQHRMSGSHPRLCSAHSCWSEGQFWGRRAELGK